jgi:hypothetical protein
MEAIPFDQGDPSWLFRKDYDVLSVALAFQEARRNVEEMARRTDGRAGWTGAGLEWHRYPSGQTSLVGFCEGPEWVTFWAQLDDVGGSWQVDAQVAVRCRGEVDCGEHIVERLATQDPASPEAAATALQLATQWLLSRAAAEPLTYWRAHDPEAHA